jgi:hypothetical protein
VLGIYTCRLASNSFINLSETRFNSFLWIVGMASSPQKTHTHTHTHILLFQSNSKLLF